MAVVAACQSDPPPISWEGQIIRFGAEHPDQVCGGTLEWMDDRAVALKAVFGEGTVDTIDYYWVDGLTDWCSGPAEGCADKNVIYSQSVPLEHELVHALRRDRLPAVFEEGFADLFDGVGWVSDPASRERLVAILESSDPIDKADYGRASHFVAFLVETHGLEPLRRLAELGNYHDDYSKVRDAFAEAYGFSLDQALADYAGFPECDPVAWMDTRIACAEPALPLNPVLGGSVEFTKTLDCGEPDVYGPRSDFMFTETTFDIDPQLANFSVWIELIGDIGPDVLAVLFSCGGCADSTVVWLHSSLLYQQVPLPAGRYVLRMFRRIDDPGEHGIELSF